MANLRVIAEIKPAGDFPVVDAPNVSVTGGKRLDVALSEAAAEVAKKANKSEVDTALASKANKSEVDTALAGKANKSEVDAAIENKADKSAFEAINASVSVNTSNIQELSTESAALSARMDEFTKLKEGSTTGDAELIDGRVGADGKTYDNIGGAIRGQVTDLKSDIDWHKEILPLKYEVTNTIGGYYNLSNKWFSDNNFNCTRTDIIPVKSGDKFEYIGYGNYNSASVYWLDNNKNVISTELHDNTHASVVIETPVDAGYVIFQSYEYNIVGTARLEIKKITNSLGIESDVKDNSDKIGLLRPIYKKLDITYTDGGFYAWDRSLDNGFRNTVGYSYKVIDVYKGEKYIITGSCQLDMQLAIVYNANGKKIKGYSGKRETLTLATYEIDITENGKMSICKINGEGDPLVLKLVGYDVTDKFKNKTVLFTGDSICNGYGWDYNIAHTNRTKICRTNPPGTSYYNLAWAQVFAEQHRETTVYGYGVNGSTIAVKDSIPCIMTRIDSMSENADYVLLSGGINDCFKGIQVGTVTSATASTGWTDTSRYDTSTFAGALEMMFYKARNKWVNAKIAYIITPTVPDQYEKFMAYRNVIKSACDKWSIPILDLSSDSGLTVAINSVNRTYTMGDTVHPNEKCYRELLADKIESFITSL
ncbi:SGNH/GDSL hydrolase family protein [Ruminococcus flavefaciens]|uniref:SGNH/GDSL hydrolase family protein n=1 Tax=Ruminococcus flavefaciens TaxID=1265 RepID=UPI0026EFF2AF|nr:SGNH/GDSL hydrolase family protein [Ruminococcus flavefaciens]